MEETKTFSLYKVLIYSSIAVILWFVLAFLVVPNFQIIYSTFFAQGEFTLEPFQKIFSSERAVDALKNSFILGFTLPFTTAFVGIMQVLFIEYFDIKGQKFLTLTYMIPLIFGGLLINNGYLFVYGPNGLITEQILRFFPEASRAWFQGYFAVLLVMSFGTTFNYMVFFRNQIKQLDYQTIQAAKNLGASQFQIITKVILPPLRPVLGTILVLSFQSGLGAFAAPLMVGGPNYETISPLILTFAERPSSRVLAAILALILGVFQVLLLIVIQRNEKKMNFLSISKVKTKIKRQKNIIACIKYWSTYISLHFCIYSLVAIFSSICVFIYRLSDDRFYATVLGFIYLTKLRTNFNRFISLFTIYYISYLFFLSCSSSWNSDDICCSVDS
ncbi:ABC transporter permease [Dolosigranulum pigrum]|uniref:ABC transporter permease n=1 Tax=Dolosigranulum pigrum TaxID=29394 RepID=UPI00370D6943